MDQHDLSQHWPSRHRAKLTTAKEAVEHIRSGQRIFVGSGAAAPVRLLNAIAEREHNLQDATMVHILTLGPDPTAEIKRVHEIRHQTFFVGPNVREAVHQGKADYIPIFLSEIPQLFKSGDLPTDVALIQISPPDRHGFASYGVSVDVVKSATEAAKLVIAQINPNMPRTLGDAFIHMDEIDHVCICDEPVIELPARPIDDVSQAIGRHVAGIIQDGATLQMGIGAIPDAVLANLGDKNDLGIHTEMFSDGVLPLVESGVINGKAKTVNRRTIVTSFVIGTRALYDFVDNNLGVAFRPSQYTNDPFIISQHDNIVAINSALEVDLTGQVCADSIGHKFYSGIGGQVDFIRGAARAKRGKPIIALPSTAKGGKISRISPRLSPGAGVVTTRGDVHYVATEYGIAYLHGRTIRERARALIQIAHPDFRDQLTQEAHELGYL